jgi:tetratricopeptide (TPR) repeat protein
MKKIRCCYLAILILLTLINMALPVSSQEQVAQTINVHEGNANGTPLSGVVVSGQDAAGNSFQGITNSDGVAVIYGQPGIWQLTFKKEGFGTLSSNYYVADTGNHAAYLQRSAESQDQAADQVVQTIYVHEGDINGMLLSGVQIAGQDRAGNDFEGITDSNGTVVFSGQPGTWQLSFTKDGYEPLNFSENVTKTEEGAVYLQRSAQSSAINSQANETSQNSTSMNAWYNLGIALEQQGKHEEAAEAFDEVIKINPKFAMAWYDKSVALREQGRNNEANEALANAKNLSYDASI